MVALVKETKGEFFIKAIEEAKNNKGHIFSLLLETLQNEYPQAEAVTIVNKVKNFDALVNYDASLAKFQIGRNGDNIRKTMEDISSTEVLGEDNFKYKQLMIKKLNVLASINPDAKTYADLAAAAYISQGFGDAKLFKREFTNYVHNLHNISTVGCWDTACLARLGC